MGLFDRFKKKKEEDSNLELPALPSGEEEQVDELPPLPEIKVDPDMDSEDASLTDDSASEPVTANSGSDELPKLPELSVDSETEDAVVADEDFELPKLDEVHEEEPEEVVSEEHAEIEPEPLNRTPIVREPATLKAETSMSVSDTSDVPTHIFVSSNDYRKILDGVDFLKEKLNGAEEFVNSLNAIKKEESKQIESMRNLLEDIQRKITYVDEVIFQAG